MNLLKVTTGTVTDRGLHPKRTANEDRLLALPQSGLFLVADGVGGRKAGQVASQTVVDVFTEIFAARPEGDILESLRQAVSESNRRIYAGSVNDDELSGMATTLATVAVDGARAVVAHVGDSRVYRFDGQRLECVTEDHSEVAEAVRSGEVSATQAARQMNRNIITRALGIEPEVEPDFDLIALNARTSLLLCSDGITRHIPDAELEQVMKSGAHPQSICAKLKELCYARGAEDNLTAVVVDFGERQYVEEQTRPTTVRAATNSVNRNSSDDANGSRFSVDFNAEQEAKKKASPIAQMLRPVTGQTRAQRSRNLRGNLFSLIILAALLAAAFFAGRYYEQLYTLIWGRPPAAATNPASNGAPVDVPGQITASPDFAAVRGLIAEKRFEQARTELLQLVGKEPANAEYRYWLGRAQLELKQNADAAKNLSEAARLNDKLPNVFVYLAAAYDAAGNKQGVSDSLKRALVQ